jgi:hypothetical protein
MIKSQSLPAAPARPVSDDVASSGYSFIFKHGKYSKSGSTVGPDVHPAHKEGLATFVDLIRDMVDDLEVHPEWVMDVVDEAGKSVFRLRLLAEPLE